MSWHKLDCETPRSNRTQYSSQDLRNRLSRSGSQVTLDSLDFTRLSEDGSVLLSEDKVAVLEFELRKAKETIRALRNNLTAAATGVEDNFCASTPNRNVTRSHSIIAVKPHEQRALNFLINEYLLNQGYKLTSITFADENESQDLDNWEDVGLNTVKPPELLSLYREGLKQTGFSFLDGVSAFTQTDFETDMDKDELINEQVRAF